MKSKLLMIYIINFKDEIHNEKINYKYEAFQFILKTQVKALIVEKHFPKEYAVIIILIL